VRLGVATVAIAAAIAIATSVSAAITIAAAIATTIAAAVYIAIATTAATGENSRADNPEGAKDFSSLERRRTGQLIICLRFGTLWHSARSGGYHINVCHSQTRATIVTAT
jgi:hypothetical protein